MVGTTISHYRILERLGGGGMGVVYKAEDLRLGRLVAVKFLPFDLTRDPDAKARFIQEARSASAVNHPNISIIHDLDETPEGQLFIVQEYHAGCTLKHLLASKGRLGLAEALSIGLQVANGLAEVHRKGIIHRDIKPSNIMIAEDGIAKIVDFGLAKLQSRSTMTKEGVTVGTPSYMSPEQLRGTPSSKSTDVWGLGVLLYEMLSGRRPFESDFEEGVVYAILHESPPPLAELGIAEPNDLERIITRALQRNPADRYPDMESIASDLQFLKRGVRLAGVTGWLLSLTRPGRRRTRLVVTAAVLVSVLCLVLFTPPLVAWWAGTRSHPVAIVSCGDRTGAQLNPDLLYAVSHALGRYLSVFPQMEVVPVERLADLGEQLGRPALETEDAVPILSVGAAQEICRAEGIDRLLVGNIEKLPSGDYSLILELKNPRTNAIYATAVSPAAPLRDLMTGIHKATADLVRELGIPDEEAVSRMEALAARTTQSIDAYLHYTLALHHQVSFRTGMFGYHIRRAIEYDSTFGPAYASLALQELQYFNFREARRVFARVHELRLLTTPGETDERSWETPLHWQDRFGIAATTERIELCREYVEEHPDDKVARTTLGRYYRQEEKIPEAIRQLEEALNIDPSFVPALNELAWLHAYLLEDFPTALEYANRVETLKPGEFVSSGTRACIRYMMGDLDHSIFLQGRAAEKAPSWNARIMMSFVYALREQYGVAEEQVALHLALANTPFMRAQGLLFGAYLQIWRGRARQAESLIEECLAIADSTDNGVLAAEAEWLRIWSALLAPEENPAEELPDLWRDPADLERVVNPWYLYYRGRSDLRLDRLDSLELYARQLEASEDTLHRRDRGIARCLATILRRERLLAVDSARAATASSPITPRLTTLVPHINCLVEPGLDGPRTSVLFSFSGDLEARTYLAVGDSERAILEYERAMRQDPERRLWIPPLYHYRLAELYTQVGASERAIEEYETFLRIWDSPDSSATQPALARQRLDSLRSVIPRPLPY